MNRRHEQATAALASAVREVLSRGINDPRISGIITVTDVRLDNDMTHAVISVSIFPEEKQHLTIRGLQAASRHIRHEVSERVSLRKMPALSFDLDQQFKKQAAIIRAIAAVEAERLAREQIATGTPAAGSATAEHSDIESPGDRP